MSGTVRIEIAATQRAGETLVKAGGDLTGAANVTGGISVEGLPPHLAALVQRRTGDAERTLRTASTLTRDRGYDLERRARLAEQEEQRDSTSKLDRFDEEAGGFWRGLSDIVQGKSEAHEYLGFLTKWRELTKPLLDAVDVLLGGTLRSLQGLLRSFDDFARSLEIEELLKRLPERLRTNPLVKRIPLLGDALGLLDEWLGGVPLPQAVVNAIVGAAVVAGTVAVLYTSWQVLTLGGGSALAGHILGPFVVLGAGALGTKLAAIVEGLVTEPLVSGGTRLFGWVNPLD